MPESDREIGAGEHGTSSRIARAGAAILRPPSIPSPWATWFNAPASVVFLVSVIGIDVAWGKTHSLPVHLGFLVVLLALTAWVRQDYQRRLAIALNLFMVAVVIEIFAGSVLNGGSESGEALTFILIPAIVAAPLGARSVRSWTAVAVVLLTLCWVLTAWGVLTPQTHLPTVTERFVAILIHLLVVGAMAWLYQRHTEHTLAALEHRELQLGQLAGQLEERVAERTYELEAANAELARRAVHDDLTGLPNRALVHDRLQRAIEALRRGRSTGVAVAFLDLDRFKLVNDTFGHTQGDDLLRVVAERLPTAVRANDTVARVGGDEFVLLLEGVRTEAESRVVIDRVRQELSTPPVIIAGHHTVVTASIGVTLVTDPRAGLRAVDVLRDADIAMYHGKALGGDRHTFFRDEMRARFAERVETEADIREGLHRHDFVLHYQPIVDLTDHTILGFEGLARWNHPRRGQLAPDEFISIAEETNLIVPLGWQIFETACQRLRTWIDLDPSRADRCHIAVNVSRVQLGEAGLARRVAALLRDHHLPPSALQIEVTESVAMTAHDRRELDAFKALDIRVHVDDFGTGYSSLAALHQMPVDALKIDRSFTANLDHPDTRHLVQLTIALARALGCTTIAEGIETAEQANRLRDLGCDAGQGYLFARPLPPDEAYDLYAASLCP